MALHDTRNPCTKICRFHNGTCIGCLRSRDEVKGWKRLSDSEKSAINARITALGGPVTKAGKKGTEQAAKLLKKQERKGRQLARRIRKLERKLARLRQRQQAL